VAKGVLEKEGGAMVWEKADEEKEAGEEEAKKPGHLRSIAAIVSGMIIAYLCRAIK
jgi:hypothetical protein